MDKKDKSYTVSQSITRRGHLFRIIIWVIFGLLFIMFFVNGYVAYQYDQNAKDPEKARTGLLTSTLILNALTAAATFYTAYSFGKQFAVEDDYLTNLNVLSHSTQIDQNLRRSLADMMRLRGLSSDEGTTSKFYNDVTKNGVFPNDIDARMAAAHLDDSYEKDPMDTAGRIPYWNAYANTISGRARGMDGYKAEYGGIHDPRLIAQGEQYFGNLPLRENAEEDAEEDAEEVADPEQARRSAVDRQVEEEEEGDAQAELYGEE